jgi:hypothetical protein
MATNIAAKGLRGCRHTFCGTLLSEMAYPTLMTGFAFEWENNRHSDIVDGWVSSARCHTSPYFRSEDQGKLTKFARLSKQMFPYILRYDARSTGSL